MRIKKYSWIAILLGTFYAQTLTQTLVGTTINIKTLHVNIMVFILS